MFQDEATGVRPKGWLKRSLEALVEEPVTEGVSKHPQEGEKHVPANRGKEDSRSVLY